MSIFVSNLNGILDDLLFMLVEFQYLLKPHQNSMPQYISRFLGSTEFCIHLLPSLMHNYHTCTLIKEGNNKLSTSNLVFICSYQRLTVVRIAHHAGNWLIMLRHPTMKNFPLGTPKLTFLSKISKNCSCFT